MTVLPSFSAMDMLALLPAIIPLLFACGTLLMDAVDRDAQRGSRFYNWFGIAGMLLSAVALWRQWWVLAHSGAARIVAVQGAISIDGLSLLITAITVGASALFYLLSYRFLELRRDARGEYYVLALLAQAGLYIMASGVDLVTLLLGLELSSVCFYVLVGFSRAERRSNEAAVKYLLLGAVSSAFLLYGFSLLYGIAGSTELSAIRAAVEQRGAGDALVLLAVITVSVGVLFKVSAVPFHTWAPDAYDGAPTPVTAFLSVASKVASFAVLLRLLSETLRATSEIWAPIVLTVSIASMTVGTIAALSQERLKRLFAYSSIAHSGYILLGLVTLTDTGLKGIYVYLLVYAVMNLGAFAVIVSLNRRSASAETIDDLRGLSKTHPTHAALFVVLLVSLAGLPPTAGFIAKYYIFLALIETGRYAVAAIASAYVVVSLFFYFRLVQEMYLREGGEQQPGLPGASVGTRLALAGMTVLTLLIGLFPEPLLRLSIQAP